MRRHTTIKLAVFAVACLCLEGCAGTPPDGASHIALAKCEHRPDSLVCSNDAEDQPRGSLNQPSISQQQMVAALGASG